MADEQIDATSRAFLGLTIACAKCHDHKFDPIPTADYYALAGIFSSSEPMIGACGATGKRILRHGRDSARRRPVRLHG